MLCYAHGASPQPLKVNMQQSSNKSRVVEEIDRNLKRAFDEIAQEDMPDRFASLLDQLRNSDDDGAPSGGDTSDG